MCRRNQLRGWLLVAFGAGILCGSLIGSDFWCCCAAMAAAAGGIVLLRSHPLS